MTAHDAFLAEKAQTRAPRDEASRDRQAEAE